MSNSYTQPTRRDLLAGLGLAAIGVAVAPVTLARKTEKSYTPPGLLKDTPETGKMPPAVFDYRGPFDLKNHEHYKLARLKTLNSLTGAKTYFSTISRHMLCPPGEAPYPLVNQVELTTLLLERPEGASKTSAIIRAIFTRIPIDTVTFQPIYELYIPYLDRTVPLTDTLFAGSGFELDLDGDVAPDPIIQSDEPYYEFGDEVGFIMYDPRAGQGDFQPRVDTVVWRVNKDELMDPSRDPIAADYTYTAVMKASVFKWTQIPDGDPTQVLTMKVGHKSPSLQALPQQVKDLVVSKYPERA